MGLGKWLKQLATDPNSPEGYKIRAERLRSQMERWQESPHAFLAVLMAPDVCQLCGKGPEFAPHMKEAQ
jgi:hypothetical protein